MMGKKKRREKQGRLLPELPAAGRRIWLAPKLIAFCIGTRALANGAVRARNEECRFFGKSVSLMCCRREIIIKQDLNSFGF
jgi:hypothetical protein